MPLYEYACASCRHQFEILQRINQDSADLACPQCGSESLDKQFSTFSSAANGKSNSAPAACTSGSGFT